MREAQPHRGGGRRVQRQAYARNTTTEHVNRHGEIGSADRQPLIGIHDNEVYQPMVLVSYKPIVLVDRLALARHFLHTGQERETLP